MTTDQVITYLSFLISVLALFATYLIYRKTLGHLKIDSISVGMIGHGSIRDKNLVVGVTTIEIVVKNTGLQSANNCNGLIIFATKPSLPFQPQKHGRIDTEAKYFSVDANGTEHITASWRVDSSGVISGQGMSYQEFIDSCLPATIELSFAGKSLKRQLTTKMVRTQYERFQKQLYDMGS